MTSSRPRIVRTTALLVVFVLLGFAGGSRHHLVDLTEEEALTLTAVTRRVLAGVDTEVEVTAFLRRDEPGRVEAASLLERYREENRHVRWEVLDPDTAPGELARLGVDPVFGGVAVRAGDRIERAPAATEQDLTAALARLTRERIVEVCISTGHGEPDLVAAAALLEQDGEVVRIVDLLADPEIPGSCNALVIAGPTSPLAPAAVYSVAAWTEDDGALLVLADPVASSAAAAPLDEVLAPAGLGVRRGVVFEGDPAGVVEGDVLSPIVRTYSSGHPVVRRLAPTYFPGVQEVVVDDGSPPADRTVSRLADTSSASYLETAPAGASFDPATDVPGPITVVAASERSVNDGERIRRTRVIAVGDVDFATDRFVGQAGNADLLVRSIAWLTLDDDLLALSANLPSDRPLALTDDRITYARLLLAGVVPALFLLAGAIVWALRRSR